MMPILSSPVVVGIVITATTDVASDVESWYYKGFWFSMTEVTVCEEECYKWRNFLGDEMMLNLNINMEVFQQINVLLVKLQCQIY